MLSQLFSNLALHNTFGTLIDEQGYVLDTEPPKQKNLLHELARLKDATPGKNAFRCIVFFKTRHGVKTTLDWMQAAEKFRVSSTAGTFVCVCVFGIRLCAYIQ